jgi:quinolinate synthase
MVSEKAYSSTVFYRCSLHVQHASAQLEAQRRGATSVYVCIWPLCRQIVRAAASAVASAAAHSSVTRV